MKTKIAFAIIAAVCLLSSPADAANPPPDTTKYARVKGSLTDLLNAGFSIITASGNRVFLMRRSDSEKWIVCGIQTPGLGGVPSLISECYALN